MQASPVKQVLGKVLWLLALALGMVVLFGTAALLAAAAVAWWKGTPLTSAQNIYLGIICGLVVVLFVSIFHLKREIVLLPYQDRKTLMDRIKQHLLGLGYHVASEGEEELVFHPPFQSWLLGGRVVVQFGNDSARVTGPKMYLETLRNHLRLQSHIGDLRSSIRDTQVLDDQLLRRLQIGLRIPREMWPEIESQVLEVLTREGAELVCDVNIMAHSERGMSRAKVELPIRDWLTQRGLKAEFHRDKLTRAEKEPIAPAQ